MQTKTKYEEMVLKEIREIPVKALPQVLKILRTVKEGLLSVDASKKAKVGGSGLCGIWKDDRSTEEIIKDIYAHRTGFGGRGVEL